MSFTEEQLKLINAENPKVELKLEGVELLAFFSLGQMHQKVVRLTDSVFDNTKVGVFVIEELNGKTEFDFSNPKDWQHVEINSIKFSLAGPNEWGEFKDTYRNLLNIKKIELLKI